MLILLFDFRRHVFVNPKFSAAIKRLWLKVDPHLTTIGLVIIIAGAIIASYGVWKKSNQAEAGNTKAAIDLQIKLDATNRDIDAKNNAISDLQKNIKTLETKLSSLPPSSPEIKKAQEIARAWQLTDGLQKLKTLRGGIERAAQGKLNAIKTMAGLAGRPPMSLGLASMQQSANMVWSTAIEQTENRIKLIYPEKTVDFKTEPSADYQYRSGMSLSLLK